jgi:hypothetical protein
VGTPHTPAKGFALCTPSNRLEERCFSEDQPLAKGFALYTLINAACGGTGEQTNRSPLLHLSGARATQLQRAMPSALPIKLLR